MLKRLFAAGLVLAALAIAPIAFAQPVSSAPGGTYVPMFGGCYGRLNTTCYPAAGIVFAEATNRSGTMTAGGTAQDLMPANAARNGWEFQNQSANNCYIRSKGSLGSTVATQDQNSLLIYPGQYFSPAHISAYAYSVICPGTGDAYYAREW